MFCHNIILQLLYTVHFIHAAAAFVLSERHNKEDAIGVLKVSRCVCQRKVLFIKQNLGKSRRTQAGH